MVNFRLRKHPVGPRRALNDAVPDEIARALDASAEDVRENRTEEIGDFVRRMEAKLDAHLAERRAKKP